MWPFPNFLNEVAKTALSYRMSTTENSNPHEIDELPTHCLVVNYLLKTYGTNNVFAEAEADIINYKQLGEMSEVHYSETHC